MLYIGSNSPFESIGGVERYLSNLIDYTQRSTNEIIMLLPTYQENHVKIDGRVTYYFNKSLATAKSQSAWARQTKEFAMVVEQILSEHKIDAICAENFHLGLPASYSIQLSVISAIHDIPIILRVHSFAMSELQTELINQLSWKRISCVSRSVAGDCFHKGADINLISTDYLGVDTTVFMPNTAARATLRAKLNLPSDVQIVTTASRIILGNQSILKQKGIINTIKAFSKLSASHPDLRLVIAVAQAPASLAYEFERAYKKLLGYLLLHDVDEKTVVRKFGLDEMPELYQGSDVFVLPSENETFGQVYVEAMACGAAVIGTKVGGVPEIITDEKSGFLVQPGDSTVLSQRIEQLLLDGATRARFVKNGLEAVEEKFTAEKQFSVFVESLSKIASI